MNIKRMIKIRKLKSKLYNCLIYVMAFLLKPLILWSDKNKKRKRNKVKEYCQNMSDEELMYRLAKYIVKDMVKHHENKRKYIVTEKYIDNYEWNYIISELNNIPSNCKDKYLANYWRATHHYLVYNGNFAEEEERLNTILKSQLEKLGIKTYYEDRSKVYKYCKYKKSLIIKLEDDK